MEYPDFGEDIGRSADFEHGTLAYYKARTYELEFERNQRTDESNYYQTELAKSHEILGRVVHQLSERWDLVNLTKFYPTDNLRRRRDINNPKGVK